MTAKEVFETAVATNSRTMFFPNGPVVQEGDLENVSLCVSFWHPSLDKNIVEAIKDGRTYRIENGQVGKSWKEHRNAAHVGVA